jgi:hypothetical protein
MTVYYSADESFVAMLIPRDDEDNVVTGLKEFPIICIVSVGTFRLL